MILICGLREAGADVIECREAGAGVGKLWQLYKKHRALRGTYDVIIVGFAGQKMALFAKLLTRKPVILDAFYSLYNTIVEDRMLVSPRSLRAKWNWFLDWLSARLADLVLLDTEAHINYYIRTFGLPREKFLRVFIGADDALFYSQDKKANIENRISYIGEGKTEDPHMIYNRRYTQGNAPRFLVGFHGTYVPLQGAEYIVEAAKLLESDPDIRFLMIGNGQAYKKTRARADELKTKNIQFIDSRVPQREIVCLLAPAEICLGIFGESPKTALVIPNKVYEYAAMKKAIITADTPAIRELFSKEDMELVPAANPRAIADAILKLRGDSKRRKELADRAHGIYTNNATPRAIGSALLAELKRRYHTV